MGRPANTPSSETQPSTGDKTIMTITNKNNINQTKQLKEKNPQNPFSAPTWKAYSVSGNSKHQMPSKAVQCGGPGGASPWPAGRPLGEPPEASSQFRPLSLYALLSLLLLFALLTGCGKKEQEKPKKVVIPVKTVQVEHRTLAVPVHTSGRLYPKTMVKMSFKTGGIIGKLYVEEGDTVKKGQLLATLDLSEINARHNQAQKGLDKAKRDLERAENLYKDRAATLEQVQNARTAFEVAQSNLKIAAFNRTHSRIKAPAKGKILKRLAEQGEMTGPGSPVFLFGSTDNSWVVKVGVSEKAIVRLQVKDKATVLFDAYPGKQFSAEVTEISDSIDPASGTYEVEATVQQEDKKFAAGFVGKVLITPSATESFTVIPVDAVVEGEGADGIVFTVKDGKAVKVKIKVAHIFPQIVAVRFGLENINAVVTSGAAYLTDGMAVRIDR